jgi:hypothetical protein
MSDTGLTVPGMTEPPDCCDVTVAVDRDGGYLPHPAEFCAAVEKAASARAASVISAHTAERIISIVTIQAADHGPHRFYCQHFVDRTRRNGPSWAFDA